MKRETSIKIVSHFITISFLGLLAYLYYISVTLLSKT